jgi:hypothetical protein
MAWGKGTICFAAAFAAILLASCKQDPSLHEVPPRANDTIQVEPQASTIAVPVSASMNELAAALERAVPRRLWAIDRPGEVCVPPQRVKLLGLSLKVTPTIRCHITGQVTRGPLRLSGSGRTFIITMPIHAVVAARDVGGVLKGETATGDAAVRAIVTLDLASDWSPRGKVDIAYDWKREPGIDFLGQRIEFTSKADAKLAGVIAGLERTLPAELAKLRFRQKVERAWGGAFTSLQLNRANPPVWMQVTPQTLHYGGYAIEGRNLVLRLGMQALTQTYVGPRPPDPPATPLPPLQRLPIKPGNLLFYIPVIADYAQLEPVIQRALVKRAERPFDLPHVGPVNVRFGKVTAYGTTGGRVAVGLDFTAQDQAGRIGEAGGTVWLTGRPVNPENTQEVRFTDLKVTGVIERTGGDLLLKIANMPTISQTVAEALAQNFTNDYTKLMSKIDRAIAETRQGDFVIRARIEKVRSGSLKAAGQGLYLPVWGTGTAEVRLDSR